MSKKKRALPEDNSKKVKIHKRKVKVRKDEDPSTIMGNKNSVYTKRRVIKHKQPLKQRIKDFSFREFIRNITFKKILASIMIFFLVCFIGGMSLAVVWMAQAPKLDLDKLDFSSSTKILDNKGKYYQALQGSENRDPVTIDEVPEVVQMAFVSIEDKRFFEHNGVDIIGTGKAVLGVLTSGSTSGPGGSTITQQLIKLTYLTSESSIKRKIQEWRLAVELESKLSKEEILEAYINKVNMSQAWGIQAGAQYYFKKDVDQLSISQAAVLASIINAPTYYNPLKYEDKNGDGKYSLVKEKNSEGKTVLAYDKNNQGRALEVVAKMYALGHINKDEYNTAVDELKNNKIGLKENESNAVYSYFTDAVYTQVLADIQKKYNFSKSDAESYVLNNGLTIYSTVDSTIQKAMEETAKDNSIFPSQSYAAAQASSAQSKKTGKKVKYTPQVGMTMVNNKTGEVVGIIGGREKSASLSMNRATQKFQPGSSTKPLTTYGPGIDSGKITMGTAFNDTKISIGGWSPGNAGGGHKGLTTCRDGLTNSTNTIAVQAEMTTGEDTIQPYAEKLGLDIVTEGDSTDLNTAAFALGGYLHGQSTYAMASAYSTFANGGVRQTPTMYTKVVDKKGDTVLEGNSKKVKVFEKGTAFIITDVLKDVVKGGTTYISIDGADVAGKTGTTDGNMHAWFCGFTKEYAGAVWYGYDENKVTVNGNTYDLNIGTYGGSTNGPAAFWKKVYTKVYSKKNIQNSKFDSQPDDVFKASVDGVSGKKPTGLSSKDPRGSKVHSEYFLEGHGPEGSDDIHVSKKICTESNMTATEYCPKTKTGVLLDLSKITYPPGCRGNNNVGSQAKYSVKKKCTLHSGKTVKTIKLSLSPTSINVGESASITVTGYNGAGQSIGSISGYSLSSSNTSVASNSAVGISEGSATFTATYKGQTSNAVTLTVSGKAELSIVFSGAGASTTVSQGGSYSDPDVTVKIGNETVDASVSWSGDTVDTSTPGTYTRTCTATYNGATASRDYTVRVKSSGNSGDKSTANLDPNKKRFNLYSLNFGLDKLFK